MFFGSTLCAIVTYCLGTLFLPHLCQSHLHIKTKQCSPYSGQARVFFLQAFFPLRLGRQKNRRRGKTKGQLEHILFYRASISLFFPLKTNLFIYPFLLLDVGVLSCANFLSFVFLLTGVLPRGSL
jgi:hypothetical protein